MSSGVSAAPIGGRCEEVLHGHQCRVPVVRLERSRARRRPTTVPRVRMVHLDRGSGRRTYRLSDSGVSEEDGAVAVLIDYACEYCGYDGSVMADIVDEIQCPMCGEPVVPQANNAGGN